MIDVLQRSNEDLNRFFNITEVPTQSIRYQQMYIGMHTILAYLRDSLTYMRQVPIQTRDYVDVATNNILSPDILPMVDLRSMLRHIESELPSPMHLPISSDDTLHFHWYLNIHALTAKGQFLLLINLPIQKRAQQLQICEMFNLPVLHNNLSAQYKINHRYMSHIP